MEPASAVEIVTARYHNRRRCSRTWGYPLLIYVVLGMHKSGTTLVAELLHRSGISMGESIDTSLDYDAGNKYERTRTADLNKALLDAGDVETLDLKPPRALVPSPRIRAELEALVCELVAQDVPWGFKDPRTCLTYPIWEQALPGHALIAVYRHYAAVVGHYLDRTSRVRKEKRLQRFGIVRTALARWVQYNTRMLRILRTTARPSILLSYERLLTESDEFERLRTFLGRPLQDARDPRKSRFGTHPDLRCRLAAASLVALGQGWPAHVLRALDALRRTQAASSGRPAPASEPVEPG